MFDKYVDLHEDREILKEKKLETFKIIQKEKVKLGIYLPINFIWLITWLAINVILAVDPLQKGLDADAFFQALILAYFIITVPRAINFFKAKSAYSVLNKKIRANKKEIEKYEKINVKEMYENIKSTYLEKEVLKPNERTYLEKVLKIYFSRLNLSNIDIKKTFNAVDALNEAVDSLDTKTKQ